MVLQGTSPRLIRWHLAHGAQVEHSPYELGTWRAVVCLQECGWVLANSTQWQGPESGEEVATSSHQGGWPKEYGT